MEAGKALIDTVVDAYTATVVLNQLVEFEHVSTSKKELATQLKVKATDLGLVFNNDEGQYVGVPADDKKGAGKKGAK